ncbi:UDP-N-acetylglucosamine 1-carboxyvinyltransferase [Dethiobacter alkaliphilus]|uniref:UDP-N-acetylglucosamine 1-carboxyvinyltransferase n=1 Tax=Dethiobacter alkaliphilus TaxID=427926 RepID=UPI002226C011|nr:UDP-N-acetylglucosamine 1-carboxyvinyltransferase [Dethiobacter alkaliphilus]MCW3491232.1 UDP-N-acetylglucosamine 1-carboxyvinyltransferase [Dethiobacter alkaliphilus]
MEKYLIRGGNRLEGNVRIGGAKNSVLPILAAVLLNNSSEETILTNVPRINDVVKMVEILVSLGAEINWSGSDMAISTKNVHSYMVDEKLMREMRSTVFLMGALLGRCGQVSISRPGGCAIGNRPIELHLKGLEALGAQIRPTEQGYLFASCSRLTGADIHLDYPSVGATENIMLAAVYARGVTTINNAAKEPEIVDLQNFLNKMGARIRGAGTDQIRIEGVTQLHSVEHRVMPDRIVAGTMMLAAAATGGNVTLEGVIAGHLDAVIAKMREAEIQIREENDRIHVLSPRRPKAVEVVRTLPYPGFPTDLQAQMMAVLTCASGSSMVVENVFESRFKHVGELLRMGANIVVTSDNRTAIVHGVKKLTGATVAATDLRAGAALVLAGLGAEGETRVEELQHIFRGYENLDGDLIRLGANIKRIVE